MFVTSAFVDGVALSALGLEDLLAGGWVAWRSLVERRHFSCLAFFFFNRKIADTERIKTMMSFIHDHYGEKISLENIAGSANISARECARCFRRCINSSPNEYLIEYRLRMAMRLLLESDRSVLEISEETGFSSASYFTKTFREALNCTPKEYRDSNR